MKKIITEFFIFGIKQAYTALFGGVLLFFVLVTHFYYPLENILYRYDFLFLIAILTQIIFLILKLEDWKEAKVIFIFHIVGVVMEIFKTHLGAWSYPEPSSLKILEVPLFTGFMYSAVGSYIARSWKLFDFKFTNFPDLRILGFISLIIYLNFFTHHFFYDVRYILFGIIFFIFFKSWIFFTVWKKERYMPTLLAAFLLSFFIWLAENIATFSNMWVYPEQAFAWKMVSIAKLGSWFLLMIVSFTLVANLFLKEKVKK